MIGFDEELMLKKAEMMYALVGEIEKMSDAVCANGVDNILLTSSGGSLASLDQYAYMIKSMSKLPVISEVAAELPLVGNVQVTNRTVAVMQSKSGDTAETLAVANWLRERDVRIVSFCGAKDSPLAALSTYSVCYGEADPHDILPIYFFGKLLYERGEFPDYPRLREEMKNFGRVICDVHKQADEIAKKFASLFSEKDEPYQIWVSSGNTWGFTYDMAMCVLEECQWLRTKSVTSPEFFHGTIELVQKGLPVCIGVGEGPTRVLDERVVNFCRLHTDKLFIFDTKEYPLEGFSPEFRWLLSPLVLLMIYYRISHHLADIRKHTQDIRRYYRRLAY
jgi:fructoselysine-6-phosphate deglycase